MVFFCLLKILREKHIDMLKTIIVFYFEEVLIQARPNPSMVVKVNTYGSEQRSTKQCLKYSKLLKIHCLHSKIFF